MKKIKLLVTAYCLLGFNMLFAADNETVYSCGFESDEDMSAWDLANAAAYRAIDDGPNYQDMFYTGTAVFNGGSQSLYASQDGGATNIITISAAGFTTLADLNLNLPAGTYTLSFDYRLPNNQSVGVYILPDNGRFDFDVPPVTTNPVRIGNANDWTSKTIDFTLTQATNTWVSFLYTNSGRESTVEGLAIDNLVLKKQIDFVIDEEGVLTDYLGAGGHVVIPDGVKKITAGAFLKGSETITSYYVPASVEVIEEGALNWDIVESITLDEANENYSMLNGVLYNKDRTTIICYPAKKSGDTFTIPATVKTIGEYAFYMCSNLTSITMLAGVETIPEGAFSDCENLNAITIPSTVTSIGSAAFRNNNNLTEVTVEWQDPTAVSYGLRIFRLLPENTYTLYVPAETVDLYRATSPWSDFDNIVENPSTSISDAKVDTAGIVAGYYSILGQCLSAAPESGVYIILYDDGSAKKIIKP